MDKNERTIELERRVRLLLKFVPPTWVSISYKSLMHITGQPRIEIEAPMVKQIQNPKG